MPILIQYLIELSVSMAAVWIFYQLVLRRLTFYNWNRWVLLGYSLIAFFIPCINVSPALVQVGIGDNQVVQLIPAVEALTFAEKNISFSKWDWAYLLFTIGCSVLLLRLIVQHVSILRLRRNAKLILNARVKLYQVDNPIIPFSFGNAIFINPFQHSEEDLKEIVRHEIVHVKQKHSIDMLWAEWLIIINWYNPFAWLLRHAIRQNLEFIADNKVVQHGINKKHYQYLLLKVIGVPQYGITTNFNFTSLKKRIAMMNKVRSARLHLLKFLFILPLVALILLAFRNKINLNTDTLQGKLSVQDSVPGLRAPGKRVLPAKVESIEIGHPTLTVTLKDGTREKYDLNKKDEKIAFEEKYGPVPGPPASPLVEDVISPPLPPDAPQHSFPPNVSRIHVNNQKATIKLKNGKVEKYDLNKPDEKKAFQQKYGDITPPTPVRPLAPVEPVVSTTVTTTDIAPIIEMDIETTVAVTAAPVIVPADIIDIRPSIHALSPGENEELIAEITSRSATEKIDELKKQLLKKGYTLIIRNISYDNGILQSIEGTIADDNSKSRFVADDFNKIIITRVTYENGKSGFNIRVLQGKVGM